MDDKEKRFERAKETALNFLTHSMRTEEQVRKRLGDKGFVSEEADYVIAFLKEFGYIDDFEYAVSYIEYAAGKGHGARRIKDEMRRRGIDRNTIEDAFYEHENRASEFGSKVASEEERAFAEALRIVSGKEIDDKIIAKTGRRLKTRGYESGVIYSAVGKLMKMKGNGDDDFE